jgi:integrase
MAALDATGVVRLFKAARGTEIEDAVIVAVGTGLRRGELLGLQWQDVDVDNARLRVSRAWERVAGVSQYKNPKSARSTRTVALPRFVLDALKSHEDTRSYDLSPRGCAAQR